MELVTLAATSLFLPSLISEMIGVAFAASVRSAVSISLVEMFHETRPCYISINMTSVCILISIDHSCEIPKTVVFPG